MKSKNIYQFMFIKFLLYQIYKSFVNYLCNYFIVFVIKYCITRERFKDWIYYCTDQNKFERFTFYDYTRMNFSKTSVNFRLKKILKLE